MAHGDDRDGHRHDGHSHGVSADSDRRWLAIALALIGTFMAAEVVVGLLSGSLALLSDAAHMLTDAGAIILALAAMRLAARAPSGGYTFGLKRAEIASALINGVTMLLLGGWLCVEAVLRLITPPKVGGVAVLVTAVVGIGVNLLATRAIGRANRRSLNVRGAYLHILTDLFGFAATAIAGLVIVTTGFSRADAIATLVVVVLMFKAGVELVRECGRVFLEAAPAGTDPAAIRASLTGFPDVVELDDLHVWQITSGEPALSAHVIVADECDCHTICSEIEELLRSEYGIHHSTLQLKHVDEKCANPT
jgi:cobalt-zinc-cadmium efflux system protein